MNYEEAVFKAKEIPMSEPDKLKDFIHSLEDELLIKYLCAKWFSIASRELKYKSEPSQPAMYSQMEQARKDRNEVWKAYYADPLMKMYIETKRSVNVHNLACYENIKANIEDLHEKEVVARRELIEKLLEFINGTSQEANRPLPAFEYYNRDDLAKYDIRPKGTLQAGTRDFQGGNN